jgi:hypothetical protein
MGPSQAAVARDDLLSRSSQVGEMLHISLAKKWSKKALVPCPTPTTDGVGHMKATLLPLASGLATRVHRCTTHGHCYDPGLHEPHPSPPSWPAVD